MFSLVLGFYFWKTLSDKLILSANEEICPQVDQALAPFRRLVTLCLIMYIPEEVPSLGVDLTF